MLNPIVLTLFRAPTKSTVHPSVPRRAFTLIELLTVIAIIGILAAILIPVVGKVRQQARQSQGLSNIRQTGMGLITYGTANRRLPGWFDYDTNNNAFRGWTSILGDYLGRTTNGRHAAYFYDPLAELPTATDFDGAHWGCNIQLMPPRNQDGTVQNYGAQGLMYIPVSSVSKPSRVFLLADAGQDPSNGASGGMYSNVAGAAAWNSQTANGNALVPTTDEGDTSSGRNTLRYRASNGIALKAVYVDGHVGLIKKGAVTYDNIDARFR
jgi:prepilin-type N-terminal cleavage/methylation domain-containing protein